MADPAGEVEEDRTGEGEEADGIGIPDGDTGPAVPDDSWGIVECPQAAAVRETASKTIGTSFFRDE